MTRRHPYDRTCTCPACNKEYFRRERRGGSHRSNWSPAYGGSDADGNPLTVSFGRGPAQGETFIADGDQSEVNFFDHQNHDHFGTGNGPNNNGTRRGKYTGRGS